MEQQTANFIGDVFAGKYDNHPIMRAIYRMIQGKPPAEKIQILLNLAQSKGIDVNAKMFTEADLKRFGLL